ncbi:MAG: class I SAM-dependent methyltransferase [Halieaceae bacterium]|jgi:precorrin-6B methylase 2|nr:class I SAM-dependent methyltransferase [Halieaceae bacterium]
MAALGEMGAMMAASIRTTAGALALFLGLAAGGCGASDRAGNAAVGDNAGAAPRLASPYSYRPGSRDGIGKWYMGREISHVMGHLGASWLERPARERQERTDLLISRLPLEADDVVADIGAGTGYFSFPVAGRVPDGRVYAVDIQREMLAFIEQRIDETGVDNVVPVLGTVTSPELPADAVDLAFIVDAYHEFSHPAEMGAALVEALKPGGRLVLIEYRAEDRSVPIKELHKMSEVQVRREMDALGLKWLETQDYLPQQHVLIFEKPGAPAD